MVEARGLGVVADGANLDVGTAVGVGARLAVELLAAGEGEPGAAAVIAGCAEVGADAICKALLPLITSCAVTRCRTTIAAIPTKNATAIWMYPFRRLAA